MAASTISCSPARPAVVLGPAVMVTPGSTSGWAYIWPSSDAANNFWNEEVLTVAGVKTVSAALSPLLARSLW